MVLLAVKAQVEARCSPFGGSANLDARLVAWFALNVPFAWKTFLMHVMGLLGDMGHVESCFGPFGDSVSVGARQVNDMR